MWARNYSRRSAAISTRSVNAPHAMDGYHVGSSSALNTPELQSKPSTVITGSEMQLSYFGGMGGAGPSGGAFPSGAPVAAPNFGTGSTTNKSKVASGSIYAKQQYPYQSVVNY